MSKTFHESKLVNNSPGLFPDDEFSLESRSNAACWYDFGDSSIMEMTMVFGENRPTPALAPTPTALPACFDADVDVDASALPSSDAVKRQRCSDTLPLVDSLTNHVNAASLDAVPTIDFSEYIPKRKIHHRPHFLNSATLACRPRLTLSVQGTGPGEFDYPWGVTFDARHGRVVVVDSWNHRVQLFDVKGNFLSLFGGPGAGAGQFSEPRGVCIQHGTHNVVVADTGNHRLQLFTPDLHHLYTIVGETPDSKLKKPYGVCSNHNGELIVSDVHHHRVQILNSKGVMLRSFGSNGSCNTQFDRPSDVFVDDHGRLLVADWRNSRISIWSGDGSCFLKSFPVPSPDAVCMDMNNHIIVGCGNPLQHASTVSIFDDQYNRLIHQIHAAGDGTDSTEPRQLDFPAGVCALEDGSLVFSDCNNHRVVVF